MFKSRFPHLFDKFRWLEDETSIGQKCFLFDPILILPETIVRVIGKCWLKKPNAESTTYQKVALRMADIDFRCSSEPQIDASKYQSNGRLG
jgi:hypothetical protein